MSSEEEITILFFMTAKAGREDEMRELAPSLTESTRAEDEGCINYVFHQRVDNPREFVLYERWRDRAALDAHLARLQAVSGLPASDGLEKTETIFLRVVE